MPNNISNHAKVTTADKQVVRNLEAFGQHPQNASQRTAGAQKVADIRAAAGFSVGTDGTIEAITQLAANRFGGLEKLNVRRTAAALKAGTELGLPNATARQGDDLYVIARAALLPGSSPEQVKARFHE
ncbi:MAG: hypothetical protein JWN41_1571, partial [Thermoleophilia bacterium]|nr:hypothetical protein [Thermoleophilia bacterium]